MMRFPHLRRAYASNPIFSASSLVEYMEKTMGKDTTAVPQAVILTYQRSVLEYARHTRQLVPAKGYFSNILHHLEGSGVAIAAGFGVGSAAAVTVLEELAACGVKRFISIGYTGGIDARLAPGSALLCTGAFRDEGTSWHYRGGSICAQPHAQLTDELGACLERRGVGYTRALVWTTDALYRETQREIKAMRARKAAAVEMEASALFVVAQALDVPLACCLSVSDSLDTATWKPRFNDADPTATLNNIFDAAVDMLSLHA